MPQPRQRARIPAGRQRARILAERQRARIPAERQRARILAERQRARIPAERQRARIPAERQRARILAERQRARVLGQRHEPAAHEFPRAEERYTAPMAATPPSTGAAIRGTCMRAAWIFTTGPVAAEPSSGSGQAASEW
jgi:hypothetical protein